MCTCTKEKEQISQQTESLQTANIIIIIINGTSAESGASRKDFFFKQKASVRIFHFVGKEGLKAHREEKNEKLQNERRNHPPTWPVQFATGKMKWPGTGRIQRAREISPTCQQISFPLPASLSSPFVRNIYAMLCNML